MPETTHQPECQCGDCCTAYFRHQADIAAKAERIATVLEANDPQGGLTHTEMVAMIRGVLEE